MAKRVLIVVSSYFPALPASMHRARMLAWCLQDCGWQVEILSPSVEFQQAVWTESHAASFFAPGVVCHEARPILDYVFRFAGMRNAGWRALLPLYLTGARLLKERHFDLVYLSTTAFNIFCLGRLWQSRFGIPYVLDFQDPWFRERRGAITSPHWFKVWIGNKLAKYLEAFAIGGAGGVVSVSPTYLADLKGRYAHLVDFGKARIAVIPFGALASDLIVAARLAQRTPAATSLRTIAYVGVGDVVMQRSFRRFAAGLARLRKDWPEVVNRCRIRLAGTKGGWKEGDPKVLWNEAVAAGIGDLVSEDPHIISYSAATSSAVAADGLLVLGVDDPAYMPSKLFPYAFTGKPLLACMHWESQANDYFKRFSDLGSLIHFAGPPEVESEEDSRLLDYLNQVLVRQNFDRAAVKAAHSATAMAQRHAELFDVCLRCGS